MPVFSYRNERGLTLAEVLLVIALIGVITAIAVPQFRSISDNFQLRAVARDLYSQFQRAKMEAIKRNETVLLAFDMSGSGRYQMFVDSLPVNNNNRVLDEGEELLASYSFPAHIRLSQASFGAQGATGGFTSRGRPSGGTASVVIRSRKTGRGIKLTTSTAGYVHLTRLEGE